MKCDEVGSAAAGETPRGGQAARAALPVPCLGCDAMRLGWNRVLLEN
jgi:hypothetical protein